MTNRALVTGGTGFLGQHLVRTLLAQGHDVHVTSRGGGAPPGATAHAVDVTDRSGVHALVSQIQPEVVVHAAALAAGDDDLAGMCRSNVVGTDNVLAACAMPGVQRTIVVISSSSVYGEGVPGILLDENSALQPLSAYGVSKAAGELVARRWARASDVRVRIVRPFNMVGPGQPEHLLLAGLVRRAVTAERAGGGVVAVGATHPVRDFVDVRDVATAVLAVIDDESGESTFNVCTGRAVSVSDCLDQLAAVLGAPVEFRSSGGSGGVQQQVGSAAPLRRIGWVPSVTLEESIVDQVRAERARQGSMDV